MWALARGHVLGCEPPTGRCRAAAAGYNPACVEVECKPSQVPCLVCFPLSRFAMRSNGLSHTAVQLPASCSARSSYTRQFCVGSGCAPATHAILFYAYRELENPERVADAHVQLCSSLQLSGRVLLATEGINGTLSGTGDAIERYITNLCADPIFRLSPSDFKHSKAQGAADPFSRELFVLVVAEIVASGGVLQSIPLAETGSGYLSPADWREALLAADENTVIIDVRSRPSAQLACNATATLAACSVQQACTNRCGIAVRSLLGASKERSIRARAHSPSSLRGVRPSPSCCATRPS